MSLDPGKLTAAIASLPLPLAQTLRRAVNGKSAEGHHLAAVYFAESAIKLAAGAHAAAYVGSGTRSSNIDQLLAGLAHASLGSWLALFRESARHAAELGSGPLRDVASRLEERRAEPEELELVRMAAETRGERDGRSKISAREVFETAVWWRNTHVGHGALQPTAFYLRAWEVIVAAVLNAWTRTAPLDGLGLAVVRSNPDPHGRSPVWFDGLRGDGMRLPLDVDADATDSKLTPGTLVLADRKRRVALHPFIVYEMDELDLDRVGFLNHAVVKRTSPSAELQARRVEYLDYDSGKRLVVHDAHRQLVSLLERGSAEAAADADVASATPAQSATLIGDFELLGELGRGAMGIVYRARQLSLDRVVALKILPESIARDSVAVQRFQREIAALGRVDHPHVVKVLTAGVAGGVRYYAMELVDGSTLAQVIAELQRAPGDSPVTPVELHEPYFAAIARLLAQAALGTQHLHDRGIIHRDLKPANIMVTRDGRRAVVMDLGLAQTTDQSNTLTTASTGILGTLRYMPPEQLQRRLLDVTHLADVYALGATLYELATLTPIHDAESEQALLKQVLLETPVAPRKVDPEIPRDLEIIIELATAKVASDRYARADALAADLEAFAAGAPISARPLSLGRQLRIFYERRRGLVNAVMTSLVAMIVMASWFVARLASREHEASAAAAQLFEQKAERMEADGRLPEARIWYARSLVTSDNDDVREKLFAVSELAPRSITKLPRIHSSALRFGPDGTLAAWESDRRADAIDPRTGRILPQPSEQFGSSECEIFSHSGMRIPKRCSWPQSVTAVPSFEVQSS